MKRKNNLAILKTLIARTLIYIVLIIVAIIVLYPVLWVLGSSFNPISSLARTSIIPLNPTLDNYVRLIKETSYLSWYRNTGYIALLTMFFSVLINTLTAFIFARFQFKGRKAGLLLVMIMQTFPGIMSLTALYMIALNFGMLNNLHMLVLIYVGNSIPFNVWLVKGNLMNLSRSIDEAAYIDGATKLQVFIRIILPLSLPTISFIALTSFMLPWMDFILPRFLINDMDKRTLAVGLFEMTNFSNLNPDFPAFCAGAILIAVPIGLLYGVGQKYLISGLAAGANKGE
ncbi:MAG: ABC transporter permease subunit [Lachnospiraceae bacterium]|nr:ABC transporter permease subunit [Lachnospiraceae bacterium]